MSAIVLDPVKAEPVVLSEHGEVCLPESVEMDAYVDTEEDVPVASRLPRAVVLGENTDETFPYDLEQVHTVAKGDIPAIKALFERSFPLQYGNYFYESLEKGKYGGRALLTWIARRHGRIVAAACAAQEASTDTEESSARRPLVETGRKIYLMTLAVDEEERRNGIASAILNQVMNWAMQDTQCKVVYLHVIHYNVNAIRFYVRMGFTEFERVSRFYMINGINHDAYIYAKYINGGQAPPELPEPPTFLEVAWDWLAGLVSSFASLTLGSGTEDDEEEEASDKAAEMV